MKDQYGRIIDYMRISITDRCNLCCSYCRPNRAVHPDHSDILSYDEILRVCRLAVRLGITKFKITGGEPFARKGAPDFARDLRRIQGVRSVTVTTNGTFSDDRLCVKLKEAGIDGINISVDTTERERYRKITGADLLDAVLLNIEKCINAGLKVKINTVLLHDISSDDIKGLVRLAENTGIPVRFIEMMPMGKEKTHGQSGQYVRDFLLKKGYKLCTVPEKLGNGPAVYYSLSGGIARIGFIEAIHGKFCDRCNRIRLSSTGILRPCLYYEDGTDVRLMLRSGAGDDEILDKMRETIYRKPAAHNFEKMPSYGHMSDIGG